MSWRDPDGWAGEPEVHGVDGRLIDLPHRGNLLTMMCRTCAHAVRLSPANPCLVPFTAFSEPGRDAAGKYQPIWFELPDQPLAFFAGIQRHDHTCVRKMKTGLETCDVFACRASQSLRLSRRPCPSPSRRGSVGPGRRSA